jgi:hypothetical protein
LLPVLLALLLVTAHEAVAGGPGHVDASFVSHEREALPPPLGDFVTKKQRHTASLEEYFAIDDDAEQYFKPPPRVVPADTPYVLVVEPLPSHYRAALPNRRPCAAPPTGPPHA